jgi:hypothetical protein
VLVGVLEVYIDYLLDLSATLLQLNEVLVDVVHHSTVKSVLVCLLKGVLVHYGLGVLPDVLLDVLSNKRTTLTLILMSWSR